MSPQQRKQQNFRFQILKVFICFGQIRSNMYKLDLPIDYKEAAAIERRRNMEEQRKSRIFNAKTRIIGIDRQALDQQVHDRKTMEEFERRRNEAFGMFLLRMHTESLAANAFEFSNGTIPQFLVRPTFFGSLHS